CMPPMRPPQGPASPLGRDGIIAACRHRPAPAAARETGMKRITALLAALAFVLPVAQGAEEPEHADAQKTYKETEQTFGAVPGFMRAMPTEAIEGAWQEFKEVQLANNTALSGKEKELIGLAVAA